jgi:hypothetical protein
MQLSKDVENYVLLLDISGIRLHSLLDSQAVVVCSGHKLDRNKCSQWHATYRLECSERR